MLINQKRLIWFIVAFVFVCLLMRYLDRVPSREYCDFRVYHHAALKFAAGENIYYRDTMAVTPFKYSPFFALCFVPLGLLPIKIAAGLFFAINFILAIVLFRLASEITEARMRLMALPRLKLVFLYGLSGLFLLRFIFLTWDSGQVTILICVLVLAGLVFLSKGKNATAGAFLAASMLIKYMPVIFLPYLIVRKKFEAVGWTMIFIVFWLLLPAVVVGLQKEIAYLSFWMPSITENSLDKWSYISPKNQSLISMTIRFFSDCGFGINTLHLTFEQGKMLGYGLAAFLYSLALVPAYGKMRDQRVDYALLFAYLPLFNPNGWEINFVALGVPYMLLIGYLIETQWKDWFVLACLTAGFMVSSLIAKDIVGMKMNHHGQLFSSVTIGALILVAALLKLKFCGMEMTLSEKKGNI